jgi:hypothetical protein
MKRLSVAILAAAFVLGSHVARAEEQSHLKLVLQNLAEIHAKQATIEEAREYVGRCRADIDRCRPFVEKTPAMAPAALPVASVPPVAAAQPVVKPPAVVPPVSKPPVVAASVPVKEKPKAVEQAKAQAPPVKPQQPQPPAVPLPSPTQAAKPVGMVQSGLKVSALKIPTDRGGVTVKGTVNGEIKSVKYNKGEEAWALIYETKDGKIVDKDGKPTSVPELVSAPPRGAAIVPPINPQI